MTGGTITAINAVYVVMRKFRRMTAAGYWICRIPVRGWIKKQIYAVFIIKDLKFIQDAGM